MPIVFDDEQTGKIVFDDEKDKKPLSVIDMARNSDATDLIQKAAPSNVFKQIGVGSANAPGITELALNAIPGIGNPSRIMSAIQNIRKNPGQGSQALRRMAATGRGQPLTSIEKIPALTGQAAGTALEMTAPSLGEPNIKPSGPFTAGLKAPETALPGAFEKAGQELGQAKDAARAGESLKDAARFRSMLSSGPRNVQKLAEEGKKVIESGTDLPVTNLLAYREALGKMQAEGGTFSNDYKKSFDATTELLKQKAPSLLKKMEQMHLNYLAKGNPRSGFPWFTLAINPKVGLAKAATLPVVRNVAGAGAGLISRIPGQISALTKSYLDNQ